MSFYENQHKARRKTGLLVLYFALAVILIIAAVNVVIYLSLFFSGAMKVNFIDWMVSPMSVLIAGGAFLFVILGSLFRALKLQDGGPSIAKLAGGRRINFDTSDPQEKKLINVTEEMAIASGIRIPQIYVLDLEHGINAFVAGLNPNETVLAVTRGALEQLSRDELQGVIGHEFSHILNGDMRINVHLISVLAGILVIGQIGEFLLRGDGRRSRSNSSQNSIGVVFAGLGLMAVGYIGLFFGRLIKAAISRQREFLADASSVQFTRNPLGIGGALYKIGYGGGNGSLLDNRHAEEMSHMCFGETLKVRFANMLATHPPVNERLRAIDPTMKARLKARAKNAAPEAGEMATPVQTMSFAGAGAVLAANTDAVILVDVDKVKASIGMVQPEQTAVAQQIHEAIPAQMLANARNPQLAESVIYALILTTMKTHHQEVMALLAAKSSPALVEQTRINHIAFQEASVSIRLPVLDIATATLDALSQEQKNTIIETVTVLIHLDKKFTLSEFVYLLLVEKYLSPKAEKHQSTYNSLSRVANELVTVFSAMVRVSGDSEENQQMLLVRALNMFNPNTVSMTGKAVNMPSARALKLAFNKLTLLSPLLKQPVVDACVDCVIHDGKIKPLETVLLRAVCEALDCPMPPIVPPPIVLMHNSLLALLPQDVLSKNSVTYSGTNNK